jgi:CRP/FNR family transcriptional regulator, cyclic AMP receptor protein
LNNKYALAANPRYDAPNKLRYLESKASGSFGSRRRNGIMNALFEVETIQHPFLENIPPEHLEILMDKAVHEQFAPGEMILQKGEPANRFFLIESGKVAIESNGATVQVLEGGEVLGWSWLFPPFAWHFNARAIQPTECLVLNGGHLLVTAEEDHEFGYNLMRRVAQVVIGRLQATRHKMLQDSKTSQ